MRTRNYRKLGLILAIFIFLGVQIILWTSIFRDLSLKDDDLFLEVYQFLDTDTPLSLVGDYYYGGNQTRLLCVATNDKNSPDFYAVEVGSGLLKRRYRKLILVERGPSIYISPWGRGYIFLIGNPETAYIEIKRGETVSIPVPHVPF